MTSTCASHHNSVHLFDMEALLNRQKVVGTPGVCNLFTSKCAPRPRYVIFYFQMCFAPQRRALLPHLNFERSSLTSKCASRHNGVHFFNILISKSRPRLTCFDIFYFQMCFTPRRRALFQHLNFQKWSGAEVSSTF